jgi:hypothetical protein
MKPITILAITTALACASCQQASPDWGTISFLLGGGNLAEEMKQYQNQNQKTDHENAENTPTPFDDPLDLADDGLRWPRSETP